ncbi:sigma-70 family RNA polymerase sigma factor [Pseudomonas sp.]|uniref:RNA polymerase sigma factor n=1 Tax=Pseudomonas sp. TaxID=306 RepID=UPI0033938B78
MDNEAILRQRCRQVIRSPQDAEDALSELRLRLFNLLLREPQRLTGIDNVPAWLRRVASNHCIDRLRQALPNCSLDWVDSQQFSDSHLQAGRGGPEHTASMHESLDALSVAMQRLPEQLFQAFEQRCIGGVGYGEIAGALAISEPNARKRVQLARQLLRGWLPGEYA